MNDHYFISKIDKLKTLYRVKEDKFTEKVNKLDKSEIKFLSEAAYNILKGIIPLEGKLLIKAKSFKSLYKQASLKNKSFSFKRTLFGDNISFTKSLIQIVILAFEDEW